MLNENKFVNQPKSDFHVCKNEIYQEYMNELRKYCCYGNKNLTLKVAPHLHSFYVYLAYKKAWKFINRKNLSPEQIDIMKEIGCYKSSRYELGTLFYPPMYFTELPVS
jgi:hypothetical protein